MLVNVMTLNEILKQMRFKMCEIVILSRKVISFYHILILNRYNKIQILCDWKQSKCSDNNAHAYKGCILSNE